MIRILDCTLRDGGYINGWKFGQDNIYSICDNLTKAGVDIVELGFLTDLPHTSDESLYSDLSEIDKLRDIKRDSKFAGMIALGEKETDPSKFDLSSETGLDVVRITFHNNEQEINKTFQFADVLMKKGYKVCMQPVGTTSYSDKDLLDLISKVNKLKPYAFYLVDTLGTLYKDDLMHFVKLIDDNLDDDVKLGFHSHNNLQMSFSNSQLIAEYNSPREFLIDSSLYGMGRGAGNLCTELITKYLNESQGYDYDLVPILDAIDNFIQPISVKLPWGYNAHFYMSAINGCHPNYASYLMNLQTLTMNEVNIILQSIPQQQRHIFDKKLIESLYLNFQNNKINDAGVVQELNKQINTEKVLVIAPGFSANKYKTQIMEFINKENPVVVSINFEPKEYPVNYVFVSNRKRLNTLDQNNMRSTLIATSNLPENMNENTICVDYDSLCDTNFEQPDNAGMMLLRLLKKIGIKKVVLAGFDGYTSEQKFADKKIVSGFDKDVMKKKNADIKSQIEKISKELEIEFLTPSLYDELNNKKYE